MSGPEDTVTLDLGIGDVHAPATTQVEPELVATTAEAPVETQDTELDDHEVLRRYFGAGEDFIAAHRRKNYIE